MGERWKEAEIGEEGWEKTGRKGKRKRGTSNVLREVVLGKNAFFREEGRG